MINTSCESNNNMLLRDISYWKIYILIRLCPQNEVIITAVYKQQYHIN